MSKNKDSNIMAKVGSWTFILGVAVALAIGLIAAIYGTGTNPIIATVLIVAGLIVGFLNVTGSETKDFLLAAVSLIITLKFGGDIMGNVLIIGPYLQTTLNAMMTFIGPAAIIVALKAIYATAKDE